MDARTHHPQPSVAIVGAGFAGLCMAIELKRAGVDSFTIYEADDEVGGTWRDNTYPGCACDVPSHLYSYSFELNPDWSHTYSPQPEIQAYIERCADKYDLYEHIVFNTEIRRASFDEASGRWTLRSADGREFVTRTVVLGVGGLSRPKIPEFEGLDDFEGETFHSARWNHEFDLADKRVGVIGTGASAVQIVPAIAEEVGRLSVFQRTPPWVISRSDRAYSDWEKALFARFPALQRLYRNLIYWRQEMQAVGFVGEQRIMKVVEWFARRFIEESIDDPELREKVTPDYTIGCKRILLSDDYYPALCRPNVEVVTDSIERFTPRGIQTADGAVRELDAVVFATGFRVTDFLSYFEVVGLDGRELNEAWQGGAEAYYGVAVSGFPNLFMLVGPNTGLGHNSIIFMIEAQARLVRQAIEEMGARDLKYMDVRPSVHREFNDEVQQRMSETVWSSGCKSWYLEDDGKNTTLWPSYTFDYWRETRRLDVSDFHLRWGETC